MADRRRASREGDILDFWANKMERDGDTLPLVLKDFIPREEYLIILSSPTDQGLERVIQFLKRTVERRSTLISALYYPFLLVIMMLVMMGLIGYEVMPTLISIQTRQGHEPSKLFLFFLTKSWLLPLPFLGLYFTIKLSLTRWSGPLRVWADRFLPPWNYYCRIQAIIFLISFANLWQGGRTEVETLHVLATTSNLWLRERLMVITHYLEEGQSLGQAMLHSGYHFPSREIIDDICDIESRPDDMQRYFLQMAEEVGHALQTEFSKLATVLSLIVMIMVSLILLMIVETIVSSINLSGMMDSLDSVLK
jgi:type II secretory pathway component PulF